MPRTPRKKKPTRPKKRLGLRIGAAAAALLMLGVGAMHLNARIVRVRYAAVFLDDLPAAFDGTTVLYASDFDLCGLNTARDADRLFDRLQSLYPDVLLLGGDYASPSLLDHLNGGSDERETRKAFFDAVSDFHAPMGKLAISGDNDGESAALQLQMMHSGVKLIDGGCEVLEKDGAAIGIVGLGANTTDVGGISGHFAADQCVIALAHTPDVITDVRISEAKDGGPWADLVLAGHTHGGQVQIAGRSALSLTDLEHRYMSGWFEETAPLLVTSGVGCEGANLRLGSQAEVWLLTLRTK